MDPGLRRDDSIFYRGGAEYAEFNHIFFSAFLRVLRALRGKSSKFTI